MGFIHQLIIGLAVVGVSMADPYEHITQEEICLDLYSDTLKLNGHNYSVGAMEIHLKGAYSIELEVIASSKKTNPLSVEELSSVVELLTSMQLEPKLVRLDLFMLPCRRVDECEVVTLLKDGMVSISGEKKDVSELTKDSLDGRPVLLMCESDMWVNYRHLLPILKAMGDQVKVAGILMDQKSRVNLEAQIFQFMDDGSEKVLFSKTHTIIPGSMPKFNAVKNESGYRHYVFAYDEFHQEELAYSGIRFFVKPQIIGEHIRVSGVAIMTSTFDRDEAFKQRGISLYGYSCSKHVWPFTKIFPQGTDSLKFKLAEVEGEDIFCRMKAVVINN